MQRLYFSLWRHFQIYSNITGTSPSIAVDVKAALLAPAKCSTLEQDTNGDNDHVKLLTSKSDCEVSNKCLMECMMFDREKCAWPPPDQMINFLCALARELQKGTEHNSENLLVDSGKLLKIDNAILGLNMNYKGTICELFLGHSYECSGFDMIVFPWTFLGIFLSGCGLGGHLKPRSSRVHQHPWPPPLHFCRTDSVLDLFLLPWPPDQGQLVCISYQLIVYCQFTVWSVPTDSMDRQVFDQGKRMEGENAVNFMLRWPPFDFEGCNMFDITAYLSCRMILFHMAAPYKAKQLIEHHCVLLHPYNMPE